jgi:subtilisin family serine protease
MRVLLWMIAALIAAGPAQAQLRLPPLPLLPTQGITQKLSQSANNSLDQLSDTRRAVITRLIRANPRSVAADPQGNPMVRGELLAFSPTASALDAAQARGFQVLREQVLADLDMRLVVLGPPSKLTIAKALQQLRQADPSGTYDFNHIYLGSGADSSASSTVQPALAPPPTHGAVRVGLIDAGVDVAHPAFHNALIHSWGCGDKVLASAHGTEVASLLLGQSASSREALPRAELFAADVYCDAPTGGAVYTLAAAFAWLAQQQVAVINVSLVGPDNAALAQIVRAMSSRGYLLIAAVGNDGPAAPPLYPAAYPHVVGVTAVDSHRRVLLEAARGPHVMFAAPGADLKVPSSGGAYVSVRGTSFAAPIVAGILAQSVSIPDSNASQAALDAMASQAIDLGAPGRDLTYGFGLVGAERF